MAKDAKGHGSEARGGSQNGGAAHQMGVDAASKGLFSDAQIATLKSGYAGIDKVDPSQPIYSDMFNFPLLFMVTPSPATTANNRKGQHPFPASSRGDKVSVAATTTRMRSGCTSMP